jgi:ribosomal protein S18 acetylase RimI-like enzyme
MRWPGRLRAVDVIDAGGRALLIDAAAQIWAEATAARDGRAEVAALADARPIIQGVLDRSAQAFLLIALSADEVAAGFAVIEPAVGRSDATAEVTYIGVRPGMWGQGIGAALLRAASDRLTATGYVSVELSVYVANRRAVALYERLGWQPVGSPSPHPRTAKPEQRYGLRL